MVEESCEVNADWDSMELLEALAVADADAALGPGPLKPPVFACGDVRPLRNRERKCPDGGPRT